MTLEVNDLEGRVKYLEVLLDTYQESLETNVLHQVEQLYQRVDPQLPNIPRIPEYQELLSINYNELHASLKQLQQIDALQGHVQMGTL